MDNNSKNKKRNRAQVPSLNHIGKLPTKLQARATALILFLEVKQGQSLQHLVDQALSQMTPQDRAFTLELLMGSLRFHLPLTLKVRACLKSPLKNQQQWLESVLILGCYQLYKMSVPSRAVIHTMVELVRAFGFDHLTGLINGVLRHLDRHKPDIKNFHDSEFADEEFEPLELFEKPFAIHDYLNVNHWLYTALYQDWKRYFLDIMYRFQQKPTMQLRVHQSKIIVAD